MDAQQAFAILLANTQTALKESLARHGAAVLAGNFEITRTESERQKNLLNIRGQLEILQELWPDLVKEQKRRPDITVEQEKSQPKKRPASPHKKFGARLPRGAKTQQREFVLPILISLEALGGRGPVADVLNRVGQLMSNTLNEFDFERLNNGQPRWHNTAQWARQTMKDDGLLSPDSSIGVWEITERGRAFLSEHSHDLTSTTAESETA